MARSIVDLSTAAQAMMVSLGLVGSYDVRHAGSRSTGWVGRPGEGEDVALVMTIDALGPRDQQEPNPVRG